MHVLAAYQDLFDSIRTHLKPGNHVYLVGGVVRDILLGRIPNDIDLAISEDTRSIAQRVAKSFSGDFYPLDEERQTYRVIVHSINKPDLVLDIAALRGDSIEADLLERDFTINAIALDISEPGDGCWIDPLDGREDLCNKIIRSCSDASLENDPVRVLRAIRFAHQFGYLIEETTEGLMHLAVPALRKISGERLRDEFFKSLGKGYTSQCLSMYPRFALDRFFFPGFRKAAEEWCVCVAWIETLNQVYLDGKNAGIKLSAAFDSGINDYLQGLVTADRSMIALINLAILLHSEYLQDEQAVVNALKEPVSIQQFLKAKGEALVLSNRELEFLRKLFLNWGMLSVLKEKGEILSPISIYRFFKQLDEAGIAACLIWLSDPVMVSGGEYEARVKIVQQLFDGYWNQYEVLVSPRALLDGHDLIREFQLQPGPQFKVLLDALIEAQIAGIVRNRGEAVRFLAEKVQ